MSTEKSGSDNIPIGQVTVDEAGRRHVRFDEAVGIAGAVIIDPAVWNTLHAHNGALTDQQLFELHHDDFAHGVLEALKQRPAERPIVVDVFDVRLARRPPAG